MGLLPAPSTRVLYLGLLMTGHKRSSAAGCFEAVLLGRCLPQLTSTSLRSRIWRLPGVRVRLRGASGSPARRES